MIVIYQRFKPVEFIFHIVIYQRFKPVEFIFHIVIYQRFKPVEFIFHNSYVMLEVGLHMFYNIAVFWVLCILNQGFFKESSHLSKGFLKTLASFWKVFCHLLTDDERWYWQLDFGSKLIIVSLVCYTMAFMLINI